MKINGGQRAGNNLFYSFEDFSILEGKEAVFENATDIENIFTRITGESVSNIDGILKTQGGANFFLVNPKGIIFGKNASLDVGSSFIATTANSIQFEDGTEFAANNSTTEAAITIDRSIGLNFGSNNGAIAINGNGNQIASESPLQPIKFDQKPEGLSISLGKILALIGNGIDFNGGVVTTEGGEIYLASVASGTVDINKNENIFTFISNDSTKFQDINLNQQSLINAGGEQPGTISLIGENINLLNASFVLAQNEGTFSGSSLNINAKEALSLSGRVSKIPSNISSETFNSGKGANINISAQQMQLQNSGRIRTNSFSHGKGGDINIDIADSIQLSTSLIIATTFAEGNAGNVTLSASQLRVNAAGVTSSTNASGNGGNVTVDAGLIEIAGTASIDRASIATTSFGTGNTGNLTLNTEQLRVIDGASLSSSSFATGDAGTLVINASELVEVRGTSNNPKINTNPHSVIRSAVQSVSPQAAKALGLPKVPTGNAGNLTIDTPQLNVLQEGVVSVENQGTGSGGTLSINVKQLNLSEAGRITAASVSGTGGNIHLKADQLYLDDNSSITATSENNGDGGKIAVDTTALLAKKENISRLQIRQDDLTGSKVATLLEEHLEDIKKITPPESIHALDLQALRSPDITFYTAWEDDELLGCGALKELDSTSGEVKSMRTAKAHRRKKVASKILEHIIQEAQRRSYEHLNLETGVFPEFVPARTLYTLYGFEYRGPFAEYIDDPNSVFMTKKL
jgi:filamentous hemagglutinin family protein